LESGALDSQARGAESGEDADDQQQGRSDTVEVRERHFQSFKFGGDRGGRSGRRFDGL